MGLGFALIVFPLAVLGMQKFHKIFALIFLYYSFAVWGLTIALMIIRKTSSPCFPLQKIWNIWSINFSFPYTFSKPLVAFFLFSCLISVAPFYLIVVC